MKKFFKISGIVIGIVVVIFIGGIIYISSAYPNSDPSPNVKVEITTARIERGKYLVNNVVGCINCHSTRDSSKFALPVITGTEGKGGEKFDETLGLPGKIFASNITPAAIGNWSDGELIRAITCGVNKDNKALFPMMPYLSYSILTEDDLYSIVAYIKTLKPIENQVSETELNFPVNLMVKTVPLKNYKPQKPINKSDKVEYGKYLVTISLCSSCHTQLDQGQPVKGMEFAGGTEIIMPGGTIRTANITPDIETGIGSWTKEVFINRFKFYDNDSTKNINVKPNGYNSPMPWLSYAGMTEEDLGAIYEYLKTIKPIKNRVERWTPQNSKRN